MIGFSVVSAGPPGVAETPTSTRGAMFAKRGEFARLEGLRADWSPRVWTRAAPFAAAFFAAMVGGIMLTRLGAPVSPVWLASAVLAWALISAPTHHWPVYLIATAVAHVIAAALVGDSPIVESVYFVADFASPILLAALLRWRGDSLAFDHRGELFRFLLVSGFLAPGVSASVVALGSAVGLIELGPTSILTWFFAQALGFVVFLPLMNVVANNGWRTLFTPGARRKTTAFFGILIAAHALSWLLDGSGFSIFSMLLVPFLLLMTFELGLTAARAGLALSAIALMTYGLFAPRVAGSAQGEFLFAAQIYIAAMVASVLPIAVALAERQRLHETAAQALQDAQEAWGELIAAEADYRRMAESADDLILRLNSAGDVRFASPSSIALRQGDNGLSGENLVDLAHADDAARLREGIAALIAANDRGQSRLWQVRLRGMNDDWVLCDVHATLVAPGEFIAVLRAATP